MSIELKKAVQQALEVMTLIDEADDDRDFLSVFESAALLDALRELRTAIQQAEAQQPATGEPVWFHKHWCDDDDIFYRPDDNIPPGSVALYTHPAPGVPDDVVRDAERYRWLKQGCSGKGTKASHIAENLYGFEWDDAIDAAMLAAKEK